VLWQWWLLGTAQELQLVSILAILAIPAESQLIQSGQTGGGATMITRIS
jgi:hypothetical protein